MTFVVDGTNGLTFNDATTQSSTATNASNISSGTLGKARLPTGSVVQVQNSYGSTVVAIANSGSGRVYADLLTISYTPVSASNKIVLIGTTGFNSCPSKAGAGAFGIVFNVNSTVYDFGNFPWYNGTIMYPSYPPDTTVSRTLTVPTGSTFNIKLQGFSYNESVGTMTPSFYQYQLTVTEVAA